MLHLVVVPMPKLVPGQVLHFKPKLKHRPMEPQQLIVAQLLITELALVMPMATASPQPLTLTAQPTTSIATSMQQLISYLHWLNRFQLEQFMTHR